MELRTIYFNGVLFEKRDREKERERKKMPIINSKSISRIEKA